MDEVHQSMNKNGRKINENGIKREWQKLYLKPNFSYCNKFLLYNEYSTGQISLVCEKSNCRLAP